MYELQYHSASDTVDTNTVNTTNKFVVVEGLEINTVYYFFIKAYTSQGAGPWSNRFQFRTFGQCKYKENMNAFLLTPFFVIVTS